MNYYQGKDNGAFVQFESICIFGTVLFLLASKGNKISNAFTGLGLAVITAIITYISVNSKLLFPVISGFILILLFFAIERLKREKSHLP